MVSDVEDGKKLTGLEFLREFAQTVSPLHLAVVALVGGGSIALEADWFASSLHGIATVVVAVSVVVLETALMLAMLGLRSVQEWVRKGWPRR